MATFGRFLKDRFRGDYRNLLRLCWRLRQRFLFDSFTWWKSRTVIDNTTLGQMTR